MNKTTYVGISGKARSGKDTIASALKSLIERNDGDVLDCNIVAFADPLKYLQHCLCHLDIFDNLPEKVLLELQYFDENLLQSIVNKGLYERYQLMAIKTHLKCVLKDRDFLQQFGTDLVRNQIDEDYWVKLLKSRARYNKRQTITIVPDVRFLNEKDTMDICFRLSAGENLSNKTTLTKQHKQHISETGLKDEDFRYVFVNDTLEDIDNISRSMYEILKNNGYLKGK